MDENNAEIGRLVVKPRSRLAAPARLAREMRDDWRSLRRLAEKARSRVQSAQGFQNKLDEIGWIVGRARNRVLQRFGLASPVPPLLQTDESRRAILDGQRTTLSALL